ncbi:MAG: S-adenosylmethionine:tRNA ribosyltransferase-isomerase [Polyangiaceae bacterium]
MSAALSLRPASHPRGDVRGEKMLVIDAKTNRFTDSRVGELARFVSAGDLVVMNDAATFPASLRGRTRSGEPIEARLTEPPFEGAARAILFGAGDWHSKTEDRKPPPQVKAGDSIAFDGLTATVVRVDARSPRLVELVFAEQGDDLWKGLFLAGKPIQYSYLDRELALWDVQTPFASRPFAVEMPSAGRPLAWSVLFDLQKKGARVARLSHAAGLSSSGDPDLDARLPFAERYEIPRDTISAIAETKRNGNRVVAIGTTVVRALEGCASSHGGALVSGPGETDLLLSARYAPRIVDAVFSGTHEPGSSHFELLEAFASRDLLLRAAEHAHEQGYLTHEFGDACLIQ